MTTAKGGRPYLSIGEVLNILKDEFEDITVSKIRFLEAEDLIQPERTSSGYRKFGGADIERLTFILKLQRDHFLPLKVIRERLQDWEATSGGQSSLSFDDPEQKTGSRGDERDSDLDIPTPVAPAVPAGATRDTPSGLEIFMQSGTSLSLSRSEFLTTCDMTEKQLEELESFAIITPSQSDDGEQRFDENAVEAAKLSRQLFDLGLDARHLRIFSSTADRWAALAEQMVAPLHRQKNPEARAAAQQTVRDLVSVGNKLMQTLLREALSPYV